MPINHKTAVSASAYPAASEEERALIVQFRRAFVSQDRQLAFRCFSESSSFGKHLGGSLEDYIVQEMEEFRVKCKKFGVSEQGPLSVYKLASDRLYFYFGNEEDPALFEAVWALDADGKLTGNQSNFRWEPKMQSIRCGTRITRTRACNIKGKRGQTLAWWRLIDKESPNPTQSVSELEDVLGGTFTSCVYEDPVDDLTSYWATWRIQDSDGEKETQRVWMRGLDHPQSQGDTFPVVNFDLGQVEAHPNTKTVVILCVYFDDNTQTMIKYPESRAWDFKKPIRKVCLTDGLSYDWIVEENAP